MFKRVWSQSWVWWEPLALVREGLSRRWPHWIVLIGWAGLALVTSACSCRFQQPAQVGERVVVDTGEAERVAHPLSDSPVFPEEPLSTVSWSQSKQREEALSKAYDPRNDGWDTEAFHDATMTPLKRLGKLIACPGQIGDQDLTELTTSTFSCSPLRPDDVQQVFRDNVINVLRQVGPAEEELHYQGLSGLRKAIEVLGKRFNGLQKTRVKFKQFRVSRSGGLVHTKLYYQASGRNDQESVQQNAIWECDWRKDAAHQAPQLAAIRVSDFEEVTVRGVDGRMFVDCTESVVGHLSGYLEQLAFGIDHWRRQMGDHLDLNIYARQGLAVADVDGDGLDDLFVCQPGGLPNRLFLQNSDGTVRDVSREAGVDLYDMTRSALFVDLDNDGDQDLVMATASNLLFFAGDGQAHFVLKQQMPNVRWSTSLAAADYDEDGDLDIYACVYFRTAAGADAYLSQAMLHDSNAGGANHLLRNEGDWEFTNVTQRVGLDENNRRMSFGAAWEDYDNDGDLDIYIANDFGRNNLYRNDDGTFSDVAATAGVEDQNFGMSITWGDYNRDGRMDLYVSNMFSSAGNRVAFQKKFKQQLAPDTKGVFQRLARGNTLLMNQGDGTFRDVSETAGVTMGRWGWGSLFMDINNDGWEDLVANNGMVTGPNADDL